MTTSPRFGTGGCGETASAVGTWWGSSNGSHAFVMRNDDEVDEGKSREMQQEGVNVRLYLYS